MLRAVELKAVREAEQAVEAAGAVVVPAWPVASGMIFLRVTRQVRWRQDKIKGEIRGEN